MPISSESLSRTIPIQLNIAKQGAVEVVSGQQLLFIDLHSMTILGGCMSDMRKEQLARIFSDLSEALCGGRKTRPKSS